MEKFDLDKALQGEPVLLRDGCVGYINFIMPNHLIPMLYSQDRDFILIGTIISPSLNKVVKRFASWTLDGYYTVVKNDTHPFDIINMYTENKPL
jgi:hypothetical protein